MVVTDPRTWKWMGSDITHVKTGIKTLSHYGWVQWNRLIPISMSSDQLFQ